MADKKISQLTELATTPANDDEFAIVDTDAGETKRITYSTLNTALGGTNTLDEAYDEGGAGLGRSITADSGAVAITVPDTSNNAGLVVTQNDTTNNPNGLEVVNTTTGNAIDVANSGANWDISTENSETFTGGGWNIRGSSTSAKFNYIYATAKDSAGNMDNQGQIYWEWADDTSGSEDGQIMLSVKNNGGSFRNIFIGNPDDITLSTTLNVGLAGSAGTIQSNGSQNLVLQTGNATTGDITIVDGANGDIQVNPNGSGALVMGSLRIKGYTSSTGDPTTTEYPADKDCGIHKNTTSGNVYLAFNDGGSTIKTVVLT